MQMKHFLLFIGAIIALFVLLANLGPLLILLASIWLLYLIFKQFIKSESIVAKICWVFVGLIVISIGLPNMYAIVGIIAAIFLYVIYKKWQETSEKSSIGHDDPFTHFENEWKELSK